MASSSMATNTDTMAPSPTSDPFADPSPSHAPQSPAQAIQSHHNAPLSTTESTRSWTALNRIIAAIILAVLGVLVFAVGSVVTMEAPATHYEILLVGAQGSLVLGFILTKSLIPKLIPIHDRRPPPQESNAPPPTGRFRFRARCPLCFVDSYFCSFYPTDITASYALCFISLGSAFFFPIAGILGYILLRIWYWLFAPNHEIPMAGATYSGPWGFSALSGFMGYVILFCVVAFVTFIHRFWRLYRL